MRRLALVLSLVVLALPASAQWTRHVRPFTGTGGTGHTYPGATAPYGLVQLSPDTRIDNTWEAAAGYYHADSLIYGVSHTHLSGTGVNDYGDVLVTAYYGDTTTVPARYRQTFRHATETAAPGRYGVTLDGREGVSRSGGIRVELAATPRVGVQAWTFPRAGRVTLLVDLAHRDVRLASQIRPAADRRSLSGFRRSRAWADDQYIAFHTALSHPWEAIDVRTSATGETHALLTYTVRAGETIMVKTGLSSTSPEGAARNLTAEAPTWSLSAVRRATDAAWNRELGRIAVTGGTAKDQQNFYTALYHTMIVPNVWSDVDGQYRGRDGRIHHADHPVYTVYSLWDTFRAAHPLYALIDPERNRDFVRSMLLQYEQAGRLPVWELSANETNTMIGFHSVPVILDAYAKGIRGFDIALALRAMQDAARTDVAGERRFYDTGLVTADDAAESVSKQLEFAYDHWAVGTFAAMLGDTATARPYLRRSLGYRNVFDPETRLMRPRRNGAWLAPFDPTEISNHYTEANAWQYSFFAPHDIVGLTRQFGGRAALVERLDGLFTARPVLSGRHQPDVTGLIGQYAHGNEPSHHVAYLYALTGAPHRTQRIVSTVLDSLYAPTPDGLPGNEDCGQMSAWFVLSALGMYPVTPGWPVYTLTTPRFDRAVVRLADERRLTIETRGAGPYTAAMTVDGRSHAATTLRHDAIASGGRIVVTRSARPSTWGEVRDADLPIVDDAGFVAAPVVDGSARRSFEGTQAITLVSMAPGATLWATTDGTAPIPGRSMRVDGPISIDATTTIRAVATDAAGHASSEMLATFVQRPYASAVEVRATLHPAYTAGGPLALTDGIHGTTMWRAGDWLGVQGEDVEVVVDFQTTRRIRHLSAGFLQDTRSWILMPRAVTFETSVDGVAWTPALTAGHAVAPDDYTVQRHDVGGALPSPIDARFVRLRATTFGPLPAWHLGAGYPAYIFLDELDAH